MFIVKRYQTSCYAPTIFKGDFESCEQYICDLVRIKGGVVRDVLYIDGSQGIEIVNKYGSRSVYKIIGG